MAHHALVSDHAVLLDERRVLQRHVAADDRLTQPRTLTDVRVRPDDAVAHLRVVIDDHVLVDHDVVVEPGAGLELHLVADECGAFDVHAQAELHPLSDPRLTLTAAGNVTAHAAVERVPIRLQIRLDGADVAPVVVDDDAVQPLAPLEHRREDVLRPVRGGIRLDVLQHLRLDDVDASIGMITEDLAPRGLLQEPLHVAVVVGDHHPVLERIRHLMQHDGSHRLALTMPIDHGRQVEIGHRIAGYDQERLVEERSRVAHAPGGAERTILQDVLDLHVELAAVAKVVANVSAKVREGDHDLTDTVIAQQAEDVLDHWCPHHRDERLWIPTGQRSEPGSLAPRHDHGLHRPTPGSAPTVFASYAPVLRASTVV